MSTLLIEKNTPQISPPDTADEMGDYLQQIRRYPRLTPQQERQLAIACAQGDAEAIRTMVTANLRLVVSVAKEYAGRGVPLLDLIQEGSIGLLVAARKFDYTLDYRFSTYATKWIRQGVSRCVMNHAGLIRVPVYTAEQIRKLLQAKAKLQQETGAEPTAQELAGICGLTQEKTEKLLSYIPEICSLDAPVGQDGEASLQLLLEDVHTPQPQEQLVRRELKATLDTLLGQLNQRQQQVLRLHFGMEDGICHSLEEIGKILGVSKERARQIEHQATQKLRQLGADLGLEDFLE